MNLVAGVLLVVAGGALEGLFSLPVTRTPRWRWENIWGLGSLVALLFVPWPVAWFTVPHLAEVYAAVPIQVIVITVLCGIGWGLGGVFWGKAIAAMGMALGISLLMGLLNVFGSPVLLAATEGPSKLLEPGCLLLLAAVAIMVLGVGVCAAAGARKTRELAAGTASSAAPVSTTPFAVGLAFCVVSAVLSALVNFGFVFGGPIADAANVKILEASGTSLSTAGVGQAKSFLAANAIWALVFTGNYLVNAVYAVALMVNNRTLGLIRREGSWAYWAWAIFMGLAWPLGIILFGIGSNAMGRFGPFVAFPMMLVMAILFGNLAGALTGEWRGSSPHTKLTMLVGVLILIGAFVVFGCASQLLN